MPDGGFALSKRNNGKHLAVAWYPCACSVF